MFTFCIFNYQDTVPCEFRMWVKCYLGRHYNDNSTKGKQKPGAQQEGMFQRWLQIFQNKWLQQQQQLKHSFGASDNER